MFLISLAGAANAQQPEPAVAVRSDGLPPRVAAKVREKAAEGPTALRRYVELTRMVSALDFRSLLRESSSSNLATNAKAEEPVRVAVERRER